MISPSGWRSLVARWVHASEVAGSNPAPAPRYRKGPVGPASEGPPGFAETLRARAAPTGEEIVRQDLTKKMKTNLERFHKGAHRHFCYVILHVGAAEHLVARGLVVRRDQAGFGRARASYDLTKAGRAALAAL